MIIGYARVSTLDQNAQLQLDALSEAGCEKVFADQASGRKMARLELTRLCDALREGDVVVIWKLDRLGRSMKDLVSLVKMFEAKKVEFKSLTENIDTTTPAGRFTFHLFAAIAEFEADINRERTMEGLKAARARGRQGGRQAKLTQQDAERARALLENPNETKAAVAKMFGVSRPTLNKALQLLDK